MYLRVLQGYEKATGAHEEVHFTKWSPIFGGQISVDYRVTESGDVRYACLPSN
jgi:hypothetical protein